MTINEEAEAVIRKMAATDGTFAVAYALLRLADAWTRQAPVGGELTAPTAETASAVAAGYRSQIAALFRAPPT